MQAAAPNRVLAAKAWHSHRAAGQPQARRPALRLLVRPAAASSSSSSREPFSAVSQGANDAKERIQRWAKQQRVNERLNTSFEAASRAAKQAADEAQRQARKVDQEYDVTRKASEAAKNVNEAAQGLESRFHIRRRLRNLYTDTKRTLPRAMRQVGDFFNTPVGAVTFLFLFMLSVFTGAFWVILRVLFSLMWISLLLSPLLINYINARAMAEQKARYREYVEEQQRRQRNPFYGTPLEDLFGGGKQRAPGGGAGRGSPWGGKRSPMGGNSVDIIDIEAEVLRD